MIIQFEEKKINKTWVIFLGMEWLCIYVLRQTLWISVPQMYNVLDIVIYRLPYIDIRTGFRHDH